MATPGTKSLGTPVDRNQRGSEEHLAFADMPYRMTRKRAASLIESHIDHQDDDGDADGDDELGPNSGQSSSHVSFILYRQHYQASIVNKNPGLANPEISKIIGEMWRAEPQGVKDEWKRLAENEKVQHSQKYPDYRYQPRRNFIKGGKTTLLLASPQESSPCAKCGGKSLSSSSTPLTPYAPENPQLQPTPTPITSRSSPGPSLRNSPLIDLSITTPPPNYRRRLNLPPRELSAVKLGGDHYLDGESSAVPRSELKRRRFNNSGPPPNARPSILHPAPYSGRIDPPPNPNAQRHPDSSLILSPLRTAYTRSVEAMVMTIPFLNKIKVLYKISPPLSTPGPTSPIHRLRGAIIAIEGGDPGVNTTVMNFLDQHLQKMGEYQIKVVQAESSAFEGENGEETQNSLYIRYLNSITEWHKRSQGLIKFITTGTFPEEIKLISSSPSSPPRHDPTQADGVPAQSFTTQTNQDPKARLPIALIDRYILSRSDEAASTIPINDRYAPVDHWQWMATLWRGIVGPDVTVYIRLCSREEIDELGGLEISKEFPPNALIAILRRHQGKGVEEKLVRRLSFEISEWVRGWANDGLNVRGDGYR
ncbi:MAG: hypothetical protein M1829_006782 [Trizodia sp. TS-e1964]|nr:MAG: hypothetical protein M1829_006782 [Trizodia sp. TS-e1964]